MIDKFNFYDIYGYFIPGAALLLLLWLPFGLIRGTSPPSDLGSAVIGAVVSYVVGHLLHMICTQVIPSKVNSNGMRRNPSDMVVDAENKKYFSKDLKTKLAAVVKKEFKLDLQIEATPSEEIDKVRSDAFNSARHALQHAKEVSYAEQFQGMYTLTRSLSAAFAVAAVYYVGWGLSAFHKDWIVCGVIVVITVSLLGADNFSAIRLTIEDKTPEKTPNKTPEILKEEGRKIKQLKERLENWNAGALLLSALAGGYLLGQHFPPGHIKAGILGFCAMGALVASLRCYMAYKLFTFSFATTVWRDFYSSIDKEQTPVNDPV